MGIAATGAERVFVTHGQVDVMVRWLGEQGLQAQGFATEYGDEEGASLERSTPNERYFTDLPQMKLAA